jgi:hypothetical protein
MSLEIDELYEVDSLLEIIKKLSKENLEAEEIDEEQDDEKGKIGINDLLLNCLRRVD